MHKKLIMAGMALAAFAAFVIAPAASASPVLTSDGVKVPVGTSVTWKNTGTIAFTWTSSVTWTCSSADLTSTITVNNGTQIKGEVPAGSAKFNGTGTNGDCTFPEPLGSTATTVNSKLCFETVIGTDNVKVTGCGSKVTFTMTSTSLGVGCRYEGNVETGSTFGTNAPATVNVAKGKPAAGDIKLEEGGSFFCPAEGVLDMDFDLYTTTGTQLTIS
jgi:hypothetical protein